MTMEPHDISETVAICGAWYLLLRTHDAIWKDGCWSLPVRMESCKTLWWLAHAEPPKETVRNA